MAGIDKDAADDFIAKWQGITASELSTSQSFLIDLCGLLGVESPHPDAEQAYMFERPISFVHGDGSTSPGRIDLYRRNSFVLESKKLKAAPQSKGFDDALLRARSQAEQYARALPAGEGRPPFLIVVDVGNRIELYSEFSRSGATYTPFPDPRSHRIALTDLRDEKLRDRLRRIWTDPLSLDPSRESARVTREIATRLAALARSLEAARHSPELVAQFLMRCLFTMFAEDVKLLPAESFRNLLIQHAGDPPTAMRMLAILWQNMDSGGFSPAIAHDVLRFNGKLFKDPQTLPLDREQIGLLIEAARAKWEHVEPAIFGTLLERALDPTERHKLGAHYTPRAYVERLVLPTVIEPLRAEWSDAQAAALTLSAEGKEKDAVKVLRGFHHRLCTLRVLDPACGSGNFLYVTLEHLKRLEGEVLNALDEIGFRQTGLAIDGERADSQAGETVDPHQLLGIELNPRAAAIAEVVLWIGYLQWHFRTRGDVQPPQPVVRDFKNIENRDAVLAYDHMEHVSDEHGVPVMHWDGVTTKKSPVTGLDIPDDSARVPLERYVNPRKAAWPEADFVVGNPPFIGASTMRSALGDGYTEALRATWPEVPESADFVMYWWHHAAVLTQHGALERFGFITTNSIRQTFNRRVIEAAMGSSKQPLSLAFAIPDHPWVDSADGAAVRIAMTVGMVGDAEGQLRIVESETDTEKDEVAITLRHRTGLIHADLRSGADVGSSHTLRANLNISHRGLQLIGAGFIVTPERAASLGLGTVDGLKSLIRPYRNGRDLTDSPREVMVIDLFGLEIDDIRNRFPALFQHILEHVKPVRDQNSRKSYRDSWWIHGEPRRSLRPALEGLTCYIATVETAKYRTFQFLDVSIAPDNKLIAIALDDPAILGVLSSVIHKFWALASGSTLEDRPVYVKTICFEKFPFPILNDVQSERIGNLAEQLDAQRKRQQAAHPDLTLTGMYNVLEKLRSGEVLSARERVIHEHGLVSVLRQLHDEIDAAVLDAYGWSDLLPLLRLGMGNDPASEEMPRDDARRAFDEAILERLVALNAERAAEEARGLIRWLRPEFQNPSAATAPDQAEIETDEAEAITAPLIGKPLPWPKDAIDQVRAVADVLAASPLALSVDDVAARFKSRGTWKKRLPQLLEMLVTLGRAQESNGHYTGIGK
ncbi:MAG TPA: DNA methyltransferase [Dokdonella sp.]|uniref:class I SAM-dependent DNA methyltransferase n=1 Tax=Dokdonella sp. TaxID=2291710 RepID=UPI002D7E195E|nr:DNA methyltransferase [Dokdonella sp.]HET9032732.1 DNA methyltransferase [Dokdonella sp.]